MKMRTGTILAAAAMAVAALSATVTGCELISSVDRNLIKAGAGGSGGSGGSTSTVTATGTGGSSTTGTGGSTSTSTGTGGTMCTDPVKDCPPPANECVTAVCDGGGMCAVKNVLADTAVATQVPSDCKKVVCDGAGKTKTIDDNADIKDDGLECTTDTCAAGAEVHTPVAVNTMCGMVGGTLKCDGAGACVGCVTVADCGAAAACKLNTCTAGVCGTGNVPDATICNDANACTTIDSCQAGTCTGGAAVVCGALDQCHDVGTCNMATGVCSNPLAGDGNVCSDGDACTMTDTCQAGTCTGASPVVCAAMDQCHVVGTCNSATGVCSNPTQGNGTACADGNNCTTGDTCQAGACAGAPVVCTPQDTCHGIGTCNAGTGMCSNPAKGDGAACSDANLCTTTDVCTAGSCAGAPTVVCMPLDQCHVAGSCAPATGVCSNPNKADNTACVGGTLNVCTAGICT